MRAVNLKIEEIYVPAERRKELDADKLDEIAQEVMDETEEKPVLVRKGKDRYVLVKGVHRLEARRALGEETIQAFIVSARRA